MPRTAHVVQTVFALAALLSAAHAAAPRPGPSSGPNSGLSPADMALSVSPREDFYRFANGGWLARTDIPADRGEYGVFEEVQDRTVETQLAILARQGADNTLRRGSDTWKAVRLYAQATDVGTRNAQGLEPIRPILDAVAAIGDRAALHAFLREAPLLGLSGFFAPSVLPDFRNSRVNAVTLGQNSLRLPNRDFYLQDNPANRRVRAAYRENMALLLGFLDYTPRQAAETAAAVYGLERRLAGTVLSIEERQNVSRLYNPLSVAELAAVYPPMDWPAYLRGLGLGSAERVVVLELRYLQKLDRTLKNTPLATLKAALQLQALYTYADTLSERLEGAVFSFTGPALQGVSEQEPLERRALGVVNALLPDALGQLYVAEAFPPEAKTEITALTGEVVAAFRERLQNVTWMGDATKARALGKLAALGVKVGYPERWKRYTAVRIGDSYAATVRSAGLNLLRDNYARAGKPVDRSEWAAPPQTVNAFYNPLFNEIVFPAAFLQPPFFDPQADPASNYGAIGYVIGHEVTHGFDLGGSQFGPEGNLENWWQERDRARFNALNERLVAQYGATEVLPGEFVNGQNTLTENTADLGGVQVAYDALKNHLRKNGPVGQIGGFSQPQRFFIAAASAWRNKARTEALVTQLRSGVHAPSEVRSTQPIRNMSAFHEAFGIRPGDPMFLPPAQRIVIW